MKTDSYLLQPIGFVRSPLKELSDCPKEAREGAPAAWLEIDPAYADALEGLEIGQEVLVLTWLHRGRRDTLKIHPRGNPANPLRGVFATRSPHRPNPIGLHRVAVQEISGAGRLLVYPLEVLDGTPILDIKPFRDTDDPAA